MQASPTVKDMTRNDAFPSDTADSQGEAPVQYRSINSGRLILPGWMNLLPGEQDRIELQLDLKLTPGTHPHALMHLEYRDQHRQLILQGLLPIRAFSETEQGWSVMLPNVGSLLINAIDATPNPPILATQVIELNPDMPAGTVISVETEFDRPEQEEFVYQAQA